jgi:PAS domain-containing protein
MFDLERIRRAGFDEVLRQMPAAVIIVEAPSGKVLFCSDRALEVMERNLSRSVPPELEDFRDLCYEGAFEAFHPNGRADEPEEWPLTRSISDSEEVRGEEMVCHLADGTRLTVRCDATPIHDDEGRIVAGMAIYSEITEQKRSDQDLTYYAYLRVNTQDAFIATDELYIITIWNKGAEERYTAGQRRKCWVVASWRSLAWISPTSSWPRLGGS